MPKLWPKPSSAEANSTNTQNTSKDDKHSKKGKKHNVKPDTQKMKEVPEANGSSGGEPDHVTQLKDQVQHAKNHIHKLQKQYNSLKDISWRYRPKRDVFPAPKVGYKWSRRAVAQIVSEYVGKIDDALVKTLNSDSSESFRTYCRTLPTSATSSVSTGDGVSLPGLVHHDLAELSSKVIDESQNLRKQQLKVSTYSGPNTEGELKSESRLLPVLGQIRSPQVLVDDQISTILIQPLPNITKTYILGNQCTPVCRSIDTAHKVEIWFGHNNPTYVIGGGRSVTHLSEDGREETGKSLDMYYKAMGRLQKHAHYI